LVSVAVVVALGGAGWPVVAAKVAAALADPSLAGEPEEPSFFLDFFFFFLLLAG